MDTLWVPVAREVPIRTRGNKQEKWLLPGGEAGGAFLRELPQKLEQSREKTWEKGQERKLAVLSLSRERVRIWTQTRRQQTYPQVVAAWQPARTGKHTHKICVCFSRQEQNS